MSLWCHITDGVRLCIWPSLWRVTFRPTVPSHTLNTQHMLQYNSQWDVCLPLPRFILKESGLARYLHSAVLISGVLLVFGGNTHNDTSLSNGAKCFSSDFLSYDIGILIWYLYFLKGEVWKCKNNDSCQIPCWDLWKNYNGAYVWTFLHFPFL